MIVKCMLKSYIECAHKCSVRCAFIRYEIMDIFRTSHKTGIRTGLIC